MKFSICCLLIVGMLFAGCSDGTGEMPLASFDNIGLVGPADNSEWSIPVDFVFYPMKGNMEVSLYVASYSEFEFRISDYASGQAIFDLSDIANAGVIQLTWDGRTETGSYAPPGICIRELWLGRQYWKRVFQIAY